MAYLRRFVLMLQFMTTIPIGIHVRAEKEDFAKGLATAPLVGFLLGLLLAAGNYLFGLLFSPMITAVLTVALYIVLTGGLHLDGLGDTADGLFSNRPRERILEIMKDSRVGSNAVLALIVVLLLDVSILASLKEHLAIFLILMPVAGRIASLVGAGSSAYAGVSDGPGRWCVEYCGLKEVVQGLALYAVLFAATGMIGLGLSEEASWLQSAVWIVPLAIIPPVSAFLLTRLLGSKLGGVTGDILGAVCELNQVVFLLAAYFLSKLF